MTLVEKRRVHVHRPDSYRPRIVHRTPGTLVHLRATQKVLRYLPPLSEEGGPSDTALGDWYVTRVVVDRVPLLVLVSSVSLLALVIRAQDLRTLPERLPDLVRRRLRRLGMGAEVAEAEVRAMSPVLVAKTWDRSVLGVVVDFGKLMSHLLPDVWNEGDFIHIEAHFAGTPCFASRRFEDTIFPEREAIRLLHSRWGSG